jgi:hypothetical protein
MNRLTVVTLAAVLSAAAGTSAGNFLASTDGVSGSNNARISSLGHALTTDSLANFASRGDLPSFDVIFVSPALDGSYATLQSLVAGGGALESYVAGGGTLVLNVAGNAGNQNDIGPGGTDYDRTTPGETVNFDIPSHPYITGSGYGGFALSESPDFESPGWNSTHHGFLYNIPGGNNAISTSDGAGGTVWTEYAWGNGCVIMTSMTYGWGGNGGQGNPQANLINYAAFCAIPTPGAAALLGLGGLVVTRRRR